MALSGAAIGSVLGLGVQVRWIRSRRAHNIRMAAGGPHAVRLAAPEVQCRSCIESNSDQTSEMVEPSPCLLQLYANAVRKLPLMRNPWEHVIAIGLVSIWRPHSKRTLGTVPPVTCPVDGARSLQLHP